MPKSKTDLDLEAIKQWLGPAPAFSNAEAGAVSTCRELVAEVERLKDEWLSPHDQAEWAAENAALKAEVKRWKNKAVAEATVYGLKCDEVERLRGKAEKYDWLMEHSEVSHAQELEHLREEMDRWSADAREVCGHDKTIARLRHIKEAAQWVVENPTKARIKLLRVALEEKQSP